MADWDGRQKGKVEGRIKDRIEKGSTNPVVRQIIGSRQ